jgi:hypothetical protein
LSVAFALTVIVPLTVLPFTGAVTDTVGVVVSGGGAIACVVALATLVYAEEPRLLKEQTR